MNHQVFDITPCPKPRMTQSSKWKKTAKMERYHTFKDRIKELNTTVPDYGYHVLFILPMPRKWGVEKKDKMRFSAHQQTPDKDNLEKALLDSIFKNDAHIWDGRATKVWGDHGQIVIITGIDTSWIKTFLKEVL